ncbi:MAG: magnesium chelatase domain-containing protein, partial [Suipraeoptans sp.]
MAFSTVFSAALIGLSVQIIEVEADVSSGLPITQIVGYLSSEVRESTLRVRASIKNLGVTIPPKRIVINLSPATVRKHGASFDLPISVALLASLGEIEVEATDNTLFVGELSLDGKIRGVPGVLSIIIEARERNIKRCIVPMENYHEGKMVQGIEVVGTSNLTNLINYMKYGSMEKIEDNKTIETIDDPQVDFADIISQTMVKRSLEIAVSGGHNVLMIGPPGSGKTMMSKRIPTIFPELSESESMEITKIYSVNGLINPRNPMITKRQFREVHHTV